MLTLPSNIASYSSEYSENEREETELVGDWSEIQFQHCYNYLFQNVAQNLSPG